jgi:HD-like signal output (HDOD) protein
MVQWHVLSDVSRKARLAAQRHNTERHHWRAAHVFWSDLSARSALATGNFARLFRKMDISPLPAVAMRLSEICRQPDCDVSEVARLMASDVGISAKVLHTINSARFGMRHQVADVRQAISLLGLKRISSLVTAVAVAEYLPTQAPGFDRVAFWQASIQRAVFAERLATLIAPGLEAEAFTGALLQDMALPILLDRWTKHYLPIFRQAEMLDKPLIDVEQEMLSWDHAQAGGWMARNWGLPDVLVCCVGLHHADAGEIQSLQLAASPVAAVAVSSGLPSAEPNCLGTFGFDEEQYHRLCRETDDVCAELSSLFNVPSPTSLAESYVHAN